MSTLYQKLKQQTLPNSPQTALTQNDTRYSYGELMQQIDRVAQGLSEHGIKHGQPVALMLYNQIEFLVAFFALRKLGAVVVPINLQMLPQDIAFVMQNAGIQVGIVASDLYPMAQKLPVQWIVVGDTVEETLNYTTLKQPVDTRTNEPRSPNPSPTSSADLAFLLYTSGTTGHPKGVMLSEHNVLSNIEGFQQRIPFSPTDRLVLALPLFHSYGLIVALTALLCSAQVTLIPKFHPKRILEETLAQQATVLPLVPTLFTVLLELCTRMPKTPQFKALRFCVSGGAALPQALLNAVENTLNTVVIEGYGLTETAPVLAVNDPAIGSIPGSVGNALTNVQIRIVDEAGQLCPTNTIGEIQAQGPNIMQGYYNLPEETAAVFTADGWLKTGDLGHLDERGNLYISGGRIKDLIIKAGENISPLPIEHVLYQHPDIADAAVIGLPDDKLGEQICACITLKPDAQQTTATVLRYCREQLPPSHQPSQVYILPELPKNATGKIVKKLLKQMMLQPA